MLYGAAYRKAMAEAGENGHHRTQFTGENEWYTPAEYELARLPRRDRPRPCQSARRSR
jgi:hypothetical protein